MLIAASNGKMVLANNVLSHSQEYVCPGCNQEVILRHGKQNIPHFAHKKHMLCGFSEGETFEHLQGKEQIYRWAQQKGWQPRLEVYLPQITQRPDVLLTIKGKQVAIEFQCSPLSLERLLARNQGYCQLGIKVWWLLGSPYRRRLGNKKVAQFTQLFNGRLALLFWDVSKRRMLVKQAYRRCSGSRMQFDRQAILRRQLIMLQDQQYRYSTPDFKKIALAVFRSTGKSLGQCPLVCHDLVASWPTLAIPVIIWRIGVVLILKRYPLFYTWQWDDWEQLLLAVEKQSWLQPGCIKQKELQQPLIEQYTSDLMAAGVIFQSRRKIILLQRPQWVRSPQDKLKLAQKLRGA